MTDPLCTSRPSQIVVAEEAGTTAAFDDMGWYSEGWAGLSHVAGGCGNSAVSRSEPTTEGGASPVKLSMSQAWFGAWRSRSRAAGRGCWASRPSWIGSVSRRSCRLCNARSTQLSQRTAMDSVRAEVRMTGMSGARVRTGRPALGGGCRSGAVLRPSERLHSGSRSAHGALQSQGAVQHTHSRTATDNYRNDATRGGDRP